jgi:ATP-dependent Clp protease ATP-binding subunit ClpB
VLTIMLQLFDEGRITDGKGTTVECKDAIFVMTSNLAQHQIADEAELLRLEAKTDHDSQSAGINSDDAKQARLDTEKTQSNKQQDNDITLSRRFIDRVIYPILYDHFGRDEFLGRINEVLFFLPFDDKELKEITSRELMRWADKAKKRHNITLTWSPDVVDVLVEGYNIRYGARSIKYEVERKVVNHVAKLNENDEVTEGGRVHVAVQESESGRRIVVSVPETGGDKRAAGWFGKR